MRYLLLVFLIIVGLWLRWDSAVSGSLLEMDGYYWKALSEQSIGTQLGADRQQLRLAPFGSPEQPNLHAALTAGFSLNEFYFYEGFLVILIGVVAYWAGGYLTVAFFLFAPIIVARTAIGWNDTDPYVIIFSILSLGFAYQGRYFLAVLGIVVLSFFWNLGYVMLLPIMLHWLCYSRNLNQLLKIVLTSAVLLAIRFADIKELLTIAPTIAGQHTTWPSGLAATAELQWPGVTKLKFLVTPNFLAINLCCCILASTKKDWFVLTIVGTSAIAVTFGERFLLLVLPVLGLTTLRMLREKAWWSIWLLITMFMVQSYPVKSLHRYLLIADQGWKEATEYIRTNTSNNSVIVSWWSPGHIIVSEGKRATVIDGGSQHLPRIFWIARGLITPSLYEMNLILAYLACFGDAEINKMVELNIPWKHILESMLEKLNDEKNYKSRRPIYLLLYKEMVLNYESIKLMGGWFSKRYPETEPQSLGSAIYFRLLAGEFDKDLQTVYNYNDGKNTIRIWRLL